MQKEEMIPRVCTGGGKVLLWVVERNEPMAVPVQSVVLLLRNRDSVAVESQ